MFIFVGILHVADHILPRKHTHLHLKVLEFNIKKRIFHFEMNDLNVDTHSHPAVEIIKAKKGRFSLVTDFVKQNNLTFAIIDNNINHKIIAEQNDIELLMIECNNTKLKEYLFNRGIKIKDGVFTSSELTNMVELISEIREFSSENNLILPDDKRVQDCIEIIENENLQYDELMTSLTLKVFISKSRLSHLFKDNMGVSIQKYYVWIKLKSTIYLFLNNESNFREASIKAGFFDQAHFINSYRKFFGRSPFKVFSSLKN